MFIDDFDWDERNVEHIGDHGIQDYEVEEVIFMENRERVYYKKRR